MKWIRHQVGLWTAIGIGIGLGVALDALGVVDWLAYACGISVAVSVVEPRSYPHRFWRWYRDRKRAPEASR